MALSYKNDEDQDERLSPYSQTARDLARQENNDSIPGYDRRNDGLDDHPISGGDASGKPGDLNNSKNIESTKGQEESAGGWNNNFTGATSGKQKFSFKGAIKKKGPISTIIVLLLGGGIGIGGLLSNAALPIHIMENFVKKYDSQNTSLTIRTDKVMASKLTQDATSGSCDVIKIACRFSRPSNHLLSQFENNGIQALDKDGHVITKNGLFPNTRPETYSFKDSTGKTIAIQAKDFASTLRTNPELRAAFHSAYNPRFIGYADSIFKAIQARFGFSKADYLANATSEKEAKTKINDTVKGNDTGAKTAIAEGGTSAEDAAKKLVSDEVKNSTDKLAKSGKGSAVQLVAGAACLAGDIPGIITKTERTYEMGLLIKYSMTFLTVASAIKAGKATPTEASTVGDLFTNVSNNKSAMDSFGMKYSLFGDTSTDSTSYKKFAPGASAIEKLGGVAKFTSSDIKKSVCSAATNPVTGAVIDAATSETLILPILNIAGGMALSAMMETALPPLIDAVVSAIPVKDILNFFIGDLTQNLSGEDVGNAFASGASNMMGQTANAGGNMPLSVDQAIAYNNTAQQVDLAYAQEDRATLSPFDISSPNTMLGSMVDQFTPYYGNVNSFASFLTAMGSFTSKSFAAILPTAKAASTNKAQYTLCPDPAIQDNNIAAGPFCNVQYGIPPEYLNEDPMTVISNLTSSGDIDANTGDPVEGKDLQKWMDLCTDGTTDQVGNCQITDSKTAEYALYVIDHRIQKTMDGEDVVNTSTTSATTTSSSSSPAECKTMTSTDNGQIGCHAYQFDEYGYLWGGGHGGTAAGFMADFKAGKYKAGVDHILDCSGLVRMAIYDAFGVDTGSIDYDNGGAVTSGHFTEVPNDQGKAGDIFWHPGHVGIITGIDASSHSYKTFEALNPADPIANNIMANTRDYSNPSDVTKVYRFTGK
jgi:hypothetical protein